MLRTEKANPPHKSPFSSIFESNDQDQILNIELWDQGDLQSSSNHAGSVKACPLRADGAQQRSACNCGAHRGSPGLGEILSVWIRRGTVIIIVFQGACSKL